MSTSQPVSPELVLVDAGLRAAAIAALPDRIWETYIGPRRAVPDEAVDPRARDRLDKSLITGVVLYTAWHAVLGAVLVVGAVLAVGLMLLALSFVAS